MSRLNRLLAGAALASLLSACATVGPDFQTPAAPTTRGYAMAGDAQPASVRLSPETRVAGPWWQALGSSDLDTVIRQALAGSPSIAEAQANLDRARADARAVSGAAAPQADLKADGQRERINTAAFGFSGFPSPTINLFSVGANISYDLDLFGGQKRANEAAGARADAEARRADAAYLSLTGNVALQAVRVASLRAQIAAAEQTVADDRALIDIIARAERAGGAARASAAPAESQLAKDQAKLPPLNQLLAQARHQLALLSGKAPADWTAPDFDMAGFTVPADVPVTLPSSLVRVRPDIRAAEADLHAATADIGVATAALYPDIKLSAGLTQSAIKPGDLFGYDASGWNLGAGLTAPLLNGGTLKARKDAAEAEARAAMARYQRTVLTAFTQVSDVLSALANDEANIVALTRQVDAGEREIRSAQTAWKLGGGTLYDVVDARRRLGEARVDLAEARGQKLYDLVRLYAATATDWRAAA
ncbi:NodT family efflux transporter outer membrane factor (OMF) lipoprotein [Caulobacter ginsengisoli]|uniref:NodT family efflux transporter outer membrane factor (OMF) lipoprotein n=1 Tax=Caulobacter ginsengisoli TaxID=400775 RepID=A0ABU0IV52_9CAUL|nr:efflux transporter outer membrane subunit [Caulobacter ginsengisoli]MDQ0465892.1 NodT family efflux transporter outer membrane factor (OMF) lipoprotein [Caulobacter ginsengisoli]